MPGSGHGSEVHGAEGDAVRGGSAGGYGTLVPGGVHGTNVGVLDMGFGVNGRGIVIGTGRSAIRWVCTWDSRRAVRCY
jgi:hypothetical protein